MENVITFMRYWYLIKRTTNSAGIPTNWINCVLYKVLFNLHFFPVLNIYCTEPYLGPVQRSYVYLYWQSHGPLIPIKIIVQFFECRIPERVLLNGAISICRRFSKVSHRFEAKMCSLSLLAIFTFWVYTLWHTTLVLYSKRKSSITAPGPLTLKLISKQARLNATKSVLVLWNWPSNFPPYWVCVDLVTMSCCFQSPRQWCWCFRPPVLRFLVIFFFTPPTDPPKTRKSIRR